MANFTKARLVELQKKFNNKKIAVLGDMMLDSYFWGDVKRISPEAPVPVVEVDDEFFRFGGAANVALNILKLGGIPLPIGLIGDDEDGKKFTSLIKENNITSEGILIDSSRPTTSKTRVIANDHHIVRIDKESKAFVNDSLKEKILEFLDKNIKSIDAIILEDYNKGMLSKDLIREVIGLANKHKLIVTVDPKFDNFFEYQNVTVFKPNRKETEDAFGIRILNEKDTDNAGFDLIEKLNAKYVMLTLGEQGIAVYAKNKHLTRIPTKARKVADVSGAGDTVISTLTIALAAGADILEAAYLANYAGGIVCEEVGIIPIEQQRLFDTVRNAL